jgi:hypothetical protein
MDEPTFDNRQAITEGWSIFHVYGSESPWQLQRLDYPGADEPDGPRPAAFEADEAAWEFVRERARNGSAYHQDALRFLREHSPKEWAVVARETA